MKPVNGKAAAYVCGNFACQAPVTIRADWKAGRQRPCSAVEWHAVLHGGRLRPSIGRCRTAKPPFARPSFAGAGASSCSRFSHAVAWREILLVEFVTLEDLREHTAHREVFGVQNGVSRADSGVMVRVARRGHGQTADLRIFEGIAIVAAQRGGGVEDLERVDRQMSQGWRTEFPRGRDRRDAAESPGRRVHGSCGRRREPVALQIWQGRADAEKMAFGRGHLDAGTMRKLSTGMPSSRISPLSSR